MRMRLSKSFRFDSAHFLPRLPDGHKCKRLHGHSFEVEIVVEGEVDPDLGWLIDYQEIKDAVAPIISQLDHRLLNTIDGLENPTSEVLAEWIWSRVVSELPILKVVSVKETCATRCDYEGPSENTR